MKKFIPSIPILFLFSQNAFSQIRTQNFDFTLPDQKITGSLYKTIKLIDSRQDTLSVGIIQRGIFNEKTKQIPKPSFSIQLSNILNALTDSSASDGELLLHLRQFNFAEVTSSFSEKGYCYIRAELFSKNNDKYQLLDRIDSVVLVKAGDVTIPLLRRSSQALSGFIGNNLQKASVDPGFYSFNDIIKMDSLEKIKIPVYNASSYTEGLYKTFTSFSNQLPDNQITATIKKEKISNVKMVIDSARSEPVNKKDIYAIVYKGVPYISTEFGYYRLNKIDGDFHFTGRAKTTANSGDVVVASIFFGLIGGLLASSSDAVFEMRIDHLSGGFIRLKEIKNAGDTP